MNKEIVGKQLKCELDKGYDIVRLSRWAYNLIYTSKATFPPEIEDILSGLAAMDAGPEFQVSEAELQELSNNLIAEGEKEDLFKPDIEVKETAQKIAENWLMCPSCQEAWESHSNFAMMRCSNCKSKLNNPDYKDNT